MGKFSSVFSMVDQVCPMGLFARYDPGFNNDPACPTASTNVPETPLAAPLGAAGIVGAAVGVFFMRRRRRTSNADTQ
jgi:hypothetical protein